MNSQSGFIKFVIVISAVVNVSILSAKTAWSQQNFSQTTTPYQMSKKNQTPALVSTEPVFEGGGQAWMAFLAKNINYPEQALAYDVWGEVTVKFTVEKDGTVKKVRAVSGKHELLSEAERVVKFSSGKWKPAIQNGFHIPFRQRQKISFLLTRDQ